MSRPIICGGKRYHIERSEADTPAHYKGFGGRRFTIVFHDGETVKTDNLVMSYAYSAHVPVADNADIYQGWDEPRPENRMAWRQHGDQLFFTSEARP